MPEQGPWTVTGVFTRMADAKLAAGELRAALSKHARFCDRLFQVKRSQAFRIKPTPIVRKFAEATGFEWGQAPLVWGTGSLVEEFPYIISVGAMVVVFHFDCPGLGEGALVRYLRSKGAKAAEGRVVTTVIQAQHDDPDRIKSIVDQIARYTAQGQDGELADYWEAPPPWLDYRPEEESEFAVRLAEPLLCRALASHDQTRLAIIANFYNAGIGARSIWNYLAAFELERISAAAIEAQPDVSENGLSPLLGDSFFREPLPPPAPPVEADDEEEDEAEEMFTIEEEPKLVDDDDVLEKTRALLDQLEVADALDLIKGYVQIHREDVKGLMLLAQAYEAADQPAQAIAVYSRILKLAPNHRPALMSLGLIMLYQSEPKRAISLLRHAADIAADATVFHCIAQGWMQLDQIDEALRSLHQAIEEEAEFVPALIMAAELYERSEEHERALTMYQKVLAVSPMHRGAREAVMRLSEALAPPEEPKPRRGGRNLIQRLFGR